MRVVRHSRSIFGARSGVFTGLMRERESAENLRVEAGAAFEKIAPKITSEVLSNTSVTKAWDGLLDPSKTARPLSMEIHWKIVRYLFDTEGSLPFATLKSMAKKSGYAAAADRVRLIDVEIKDLASRALKIRAASLAGTRSQALALLALDRIRYGWQWNFAREDVLTLSRSVVALSKAQGRADERARSRAGQGSAGRGGLGRAFHRARHRRRARGARPRSGATLGCPQGRQAADDP
jgi:hypothetical protein